MIEFFTGEDIASGDYKLSKSQDYDKFLLGLGIAEARRSELESATPLITISKDGDEWNITEKSELGIKETKFQMGEAFDDVLLNGVGTKSIASEHGPFLILMHTPLDGSDMVSVSHEFLENQVRVSLSVRDAAAVRIFDRL
ncbi:uncharacterized protein TrAtP1_011871 [Trichoderma atroviride]|uniref:uncharacterized protein n=1 Tax=Hypocrea atroviridis TaxID=63577 RepID=UPI00332708EE|nr:hypothetical protein TrAtP1_011871 [Trichoderma atroviride]